MRLRNPTYILIIAFAAINVFSQGENSICGAYKSGELTIPSYRFVVVDKQANKIATAKASGILIVTEGIWKGTWFEGHWDDVHHDVGIDVRYDAREGVYISQEMPELKLARRKKGGFLGIGSGCWDRVQSLFYSFTDENGDRGSLNIFFPNKKGKKPPLPDPTTVISVTLKYDEKGSSIP